MGIFDWFKKKTNADKQGGKWENYANDKGEKIQMHTSKTGKVAVFKDGKKVNKKSWG